jgi:hypothetical protein
MSYRIVRQIFAAMLIFSALAALVRADNVPGWDADTFNKASTIKVMTTEPEVGEHWFNLWVVVIDGQPYVRLGDRSYGRIQRNTTSPYVKLKVGEQEFDKVKIVETPDMQDKVAAAMADKYWLDFMVRHESHPAVARLVPEAATNPAGGESKGAAN